MLESAAVLKQIIREDTTPFALVAEQSVDNVSRASLSVAHVHTVIDPPFPAWRVWFCARRKLHEACLSVQFP